MATHPPRAPPDPDDRTERDGEAPMILTTLTYLMTAVPLLEEAPDPPKVFRTLAFADARALAEKEGRWLVVDFTATWCSPCKQMDATTWIAPQVTAWLAQRTVAIQVDIDAEPEVARAHVIASVPTLVILKGSNEVDRKSGFQTAQELLRWFENVHEGSNALDALREFATSNDVRMRHQLARALLERRLDEEAFSHYQWLWKHALQHEPSYRAVRLSYWAAEIGTLCRRLPAAREVFARLRNEAFERWHVDLKSHREDAADWVALNAYLRDRDQTLAWYEAAHSDPRWQTTFQELLGDVYEGYLARGNYAAAGKARGWPSPHAEMLAKTRAQALEHAGEDLQAVQQAHATFERRIAQLYAATLAADHDTWAQSVAQDGLAIDPSPGMRIELVDHVLRAGVATASHRTWLAGIRDDVPGVRDVRRRLENALRKD